MELRHLRYFQAVAEELHFRKAAERLHISQPPLSQQIKDLEQELGVRLFERNRRSVELTPAGEVLLGETRRLFSLLNRMVENTKRASAGLIGNLSIAFVGSLSHSILPPLLRNFKSMYPDIDLKLQPLTTGEQLTAIKRGDVDVGLVRDLPQQAGLQVVNLFSEELIVAVPENHPAAADDRVSLASLKKESFITVPRSHAPDFYDQFIGGCLAAGFSPQISQVVPQFSSMLGLVSAEIGICIGPRSLASSPVRGVAYLALEDPLLSTVCLVRPDAMHKREAELFQDSLIDYIAGADMSAFAG